MTCVRIVTEEIVGAEPAYVHLTVPGDGIKGTVTLFVSDRPNGPTGSMVYALPSSKGVVSTRLSIFEDSIDSTERVAKGLAKKFDCPVVVASSGSLSVAATSSIIRFVERNYRH
ncbi:hypothetical protein TRVA0_001S00584 [Trichomonascus vanleenenianus]|uniref:proteasome assembly chaperone 4 family protein n=1 Tax=Trichomonascus vanleenenianus TaxID=2268995 RepID=UPI003ECB7843